MPVTPVPDTADADELLTLAEAAILRTAGATLRAIYNRVAYAGYANDPKVAMDRGRIAHAAAIADDVLFDAVVVLGTWGESSAAQSAVKGWND